MAVVVAEGPTDLDDLTHSAVGTRQRTLGFGFWLAVFWFVLVVLLAVLAPILPLENPDKVGLGERYEGPSREFWFGTDLLGRDVFSRTIWAARVSLVIGVFAITFGMIVGGTIGILSGYFRGMLDMVTSFIMFTLLSFPALVLAILVISLLDKDVQTVALTIGILSVAPVGRLTRATTIQYSEREFVQAARVVGAKNSRIIIRELLPNVVIPMGGLTLLGMAIAIVAEGNLAFLGLGDPDRLSWGQLILENSSSRNLQEGFHAAFFPILIMFLTVLSLNFAGDRVRQYFDVRESAF
jgi:peptide/nickel transport system permease protein